MHAHIALWADGTGRPGQEAALTEAFSALA